jgi:hypothetical protein
MNHSLPRADLCFAPVRPGPRVPQQVEQGARQDDIALEARRTDDQRKWPPSSRHGRPTGSATGAIPPSHTDPHRLTSPLDARCPPTATTTTEAPLDEPARAEPGSALVARANGLVGQVEGGRQAAPGQPAAGRLDHKDFAHPVGGQVEPGLPSGLVVGHHERTLFVHLRDRVASGSSLAVCVPPPPSLAPPNGRQRPVATDQQPHTHGKPTVIHGYICVRIVRRHR